VGSRVSQLERPVDSRLSGRRRTPARVRTGRNRPLRDRNLQTLRELIGGGFKAFTQQGKFTGAGGFKRRPEFPDVSTFDELLANRRPSGDAWQAYVTWTGSDASGRPLFAPRNTPRQFVQTLREAFDKLEVDKQFLADLKKVAGEDLDLMPAKEAEPILQRLLNVSPGVQDFIKTITKKHLQR
jgi:hypothetical protein